MNLQYVRVWTDFVHAGGTLLATIPPEEIVSANLTERIPENRTLDIVFSRDSQAWDSIQSRRVLQIMTDDPVLNEAEFRLARFSEGRVQATQATLSARWPVFDLKNGMIVRSEANGTENAFFTLLGRTRDQLVDVALAAAPGYFVKGTIEDASTVVDTFTFRYDTPLSCLQELAALEGLELSVTREASNFAVHLLKKTGQPGPSLSRTSTGLLYKDDFNRPDEDNDSGPLNGWAQAPAGTFGVRSNEMTANIDGASSASDMQLTNSPPGLPQTQLEMVVCARNRQEGPGGGGQFLACKLGALDMVGGGVTRWETEVRSNPTDFTMRVITNGGQTDFFNTGTLPAGVTPGQNYTNKFHVSNRGGHGGSSFQRAWLEGVLIHAATRTDHDYPGSTQDVSDNSWGGARIGRDGNNFIGDQGIWDDFSICETNTISATGLPAGYKLRIAGLVAVESGGTAALDMLGSFFPQSLVEILDGSDNLVVALSLPLDVWGGDVFDFASTATAPVPEIRYTKNLRTINRQRDASKMANRIYPVGGGDDAVRLNIAEAQWIVDAVPSATEIDVRDEPIFNDDNLVGKFIERADGSRFQIQSTDVVLQRIETTSAHGLSPLDVIKLREDGGGKKLIFVEDEQSQATYGLAVDSLDAGDISNVDNLIENPTVAFSGALPDNTTLVGAPTVTEENDQRFVQAGASSAKVVALEGEGITFDAVGIIAVDPLRYFSFFSSVYIESGGVEMYATHSTEGRFPLEGAADEAISTTTGGFVRLSVEGKEWPSGTVSISIIARGGPATFYVDQAQLTNSSGNFAFFPGLGSRSLYLRGLQILAERSTPLTSYTVQSLDLYEALRTQFPNDRITLGGDVLVQDADLSILVQTRVLEVRRSLKTPGEVSVVLSNKREDLIDALTDLRRRARQGDPIPPLFAGIGSIDITHEDNGDLLLQFLGVGSTRSFKYVISRIAMPTYADVIANGTVGNTIDGTEFPVGGSVTNIGRAQRAFVRVVAFPQLNGAGQPGQTSTDVTGPPSFWSAQITGTSESQAGGSDAGEATVRRSFTVDTRAAGIRMYRKKGAWPTKDGTQTGEPDPLFDRGVIDERDGFAYEDAGWTTGDVVHDIAIAIDTNGTEGEREEHQYTVLTDGGGGGGSPRFTSVVRANTQLGTACTPGNKRQERITWITADASDVNEDVVILRQIDGAGFVVVHTQPNPVSVTQWEDTTIEFIADAFGALHPVDYIVELRTGVTVRDSATRNEQLPSQKWQNCTPE